jgi:hypothetical protein
MQIPKLGAEPLGKRGREKEEEEGEEAEPERMRGALDASTTSRLSAVLPRPSMLSSVGEIEAAGGFEGMEGAPELDLTTEKEIEK